VRTALVEARTWVDDVMASIKVLSEIGDAVGFPELVAKVDKETSWYFKKDEFKSLFKDTFPADEQCMDKTLLDIGGKLKCSAKQFILHIADCIARAAYLAPEGNGELTEAAQTFKSVADAFGVGELKTLAGTVAQWTQHFVQKSFADGICATDFETIHIMLKLVEELMPLINDGCAYDLKRYKDEYHPELLERVGNLCSGPRDVLEKTASACKKLCVSVGIAFDMQYLAGVPDDEADRLGASTLEACLPKGPINF
jgi:hypothetical protein